ncbi:MAG: IS66 family transposase, partial [Gammaproteobacteria bacterium]
AGEALIPIYEAYWEIITSSNYLQVDETPVKILNPNKKGYLWTYFAPLVGEGLVVYELALTRASQVVDERLANFKGLVQTDGYSGYNGLRKNKYITNLECMSHTRRKYDMVLKITNNKEGIAAEMIERLKPLYALEKRMREAGINFHTRKRLRQKYAKPLLKEIYKWLKKIKNQVPPKSKLMEAINYTLNQWKYLIVYLKHGQAEIDNNWIENKNRPVALGRRNWLFMGNNESGKINALWFTFVESALINNLNPRIYIHYLLTQIHAVRQKTIDVKTLLPHTIDRAVLEKFAIEQMKIAKEVFNSISISGKDNDFNFLNVYSRGYINKDLSPVTPHPETKKKNLKDFLASININNTS